MAAKLPEILSIDEEYFYSRNAGFLVFPFLAAYFVWKNKLPVKKIALLAGIMAIALVFINLLPNNPTSDTVSYTHLFYFRGIADKNKFLEKGAF